MHKANVFAIFESRVRFARKELHCAGSQRPQSILWIVAALLLQASCLQARAVAALRAVGTSVWYATFCMLRGLSFFGWLWLGLASVWLAVSCDWVALGWACLHTKCVQLTCATP